MLLRRGYGALRSRVVGVLKLGVVSGDDVRVRVAYLVERVIVRRAAKAIHLIAAQQGE